MESKWNQEVACKKCLEKIHSEWEGHFVSCKCGAISVDQTQYYSRYIGNREDFLFDNTEEALQQ